jgi:dipeptidyl aminopeptidase/acylaminoacyl peptidase
MAKSWPKWQKHLESQVSRLVFTSIRNGSQNVYLKSASGTNPETLLLESDGDAFPSDWSPDGRFLLYENVTSNGKWGLWALPMTGEPKPFPVTQAAFRAERGRFSPDGRLIAYLSDDSGPNEVYVQAFPQAADRWQVSTGGASRPRWRKDGKELFYISADGQLMSVAIETRPVFTASAPRPLFRFSPAALLLEKPCVTAPCVYSPYEVAPDGQRFLSIVSERETPKPPINLVFNWLPESKR